MISLGFQHVLTMFTATVLVALLTGFEHSRSTVRQSGEARHV